MAQRSVSALHTAITRSVHDAVTEEPLALSTDAADDADVCSQIDAACREISDEAERISNASDRLVDVEAVFAAWTDARI